MAPDPLDAIDDAGQVAGGIRVRAGPAAHDQGQRLALAVGEAGREHDLGPVGLLQQAGGPRAARAPPASARRSGSPPRGRRRSAARPACAYTSFQCAALCSTSGPYSDDASRGRRCCSRTTRWRARSLKSSSRCELVVGRPCRRRRGRRARASAARSATEIDEVLDEHPERPAPVADVVLAHDVVAEHVEHPHERVTDHRRAEVPDVHLLGHVGRRVVDDDAFGRSRRDDAESGRRRRRRRRARR